MNHDGLATNIAIMAFSLAALVASLLAISLSDKSWINWYTFPCVTSIGTLYVLPTLYMWNFGPSGSTFAYVYSYATYALMSLSVAAGYCWTKPITVRRRAIQCAGPLNVLPWALLISAFFVYLPVLLAFRQFIGQPREIYAGFSAAGLGLNFFGSATLVTLAFVTYLFKARTSYAGFTIFILACVALVYLHGSKGQLLSFVIIAILYRTYVKRKKASFATASLLIAGIVIISCLLFALFSSVSDQIELITNMANYSDYSRNAMKVIDDPILPKYLGQLTFEEEFYSRMPKILFPGKPHDYGQVKLTKRYDPATYRESSGSPAFGIGLQYADFGPFAIFVLSFGSLFTGWLARCVVAALTLRASPSRFLVLLFLSGISLIPLGAGYLLPETLLIAVLFSFIQRHPFKLLKLESRLQPAQRGT